MRKFAFFILIVAISYGLFSADAEKKYPKIKKLLAKQTKMLEEFIQADPTIKDAKSAAAVLTNFYKAMEEMIPLIVEIAEEHKDIENMFGNNPPEELKADILKLKKLGGRMSQSFGKIKFYSSDPQIKKAYQEMMKVQIKLQKSIKGKIKDKKKSNKK